MCSDTHSNMYSYLSSEDCVNMQVRKEILRFMEKIIKAFSIYDTASILPEKEQTVPPVNEEAETVLSVNEETTVQMEVENSVPEVDTTPVQEAKQDTTRPDTDSPEARPTMQQDKIIYVSRPRTPAQNKPVLKEIKGVTYYYRPGDNTPRVFNRYFSKEK